MPTTIEYANNPNEETAFVTPEGGQRTRAVLTTSVDGTVKFPDNPNSTKVSVTVDGVARKAVAVYNLGGGDSHNLGYYATQAALEEAHPTAEAGDFAIVGSTDTVWIWDADTSAWVDSDQKGQVTSVNNQTGAVTIGANDVLPSQTGYSGRVLGTDGFVAGWVKPEIVQRSTMPVASQDEEGNIYQFIGTTDANYTNGYFYECVSDGGNPATYSWAQTNVQPQGSSLPSQTGNSGKFLTTDGTDASWSDKPLVNKSAQTGSVAIQGVAYASYATTVGVNSSAAGSYSVAVGYYAQGGSSKSTVCGGNAYAAEQGVAIGYNSKGGNWGQLSAVAVGYNAQATVGNAIQLGSGVNSTANTFSVGLSNSNNYLLLNSDGTIPTDRFTTTPSADGTYVPTLTISSGVATRSWAAPSGGGSVPTLTWYSVSSAGNTLTISDTSSAQLVKIYKNGLLLQPTEDYTISGTTLTTVAALAVGDKITTEVF